MDTSNWNGWFFKKNRKIKAIKLGWLGKRNGCGITWEREVNMIKTCYMKTFQRIK